MMKKYTVLLLLLISIATYADPYLPQNGESYTLDSDGYVISFGNDPAFDNRGSTAGTAAVVRTDTRIKAWATSVASVNFGGNMTTNAYDYSDVDYADATKALGPATGDHYYGIVALGSGGSIVLHFNSGISDGVGLDFAVFENVDFAGFVELAYVEVSSDGVHFVRFPNFYLGTSQLGAYENANYPKLSYNLGSKYYKQFGHGYDLAELEYTYDFITSGKSEFTDEYKESFLLNYQYLDLENVSYVRIEDIPGDGSRLDSEGYEIYDPYKTEGPAGFDLQGVAVINTATVPEPAEVVSIFGASALIFAMLFRRRK